MRAISINRSDDGAVGVIVDGGEPRTLINPTNIIVKALPEDEGVIIKKSDETWRQHLESDDQVTIDGTPAPTVTADLINILSNNVFGDSTDKIAQTITFADPADRAHTAPAFQLVGTSSSGLPVSFASSDDAVFTIDEDGILTPVAAGTANITATQAGNAFYDAATPVVHPLTLT